MIYTSLDNVEEFTMPLHGIYAHGELAWFLGYDVIETTSLELYVEYQKLINQEYVCSTFDTYAKRKDGEVKKVTCYLWYSIKLKTARGLVVCYNNKEDIKFAKEKYKELANAL